MNRLGLGLAALMIAAGLIGCQEKTGTNDPNPAAKADPTLPPTGPSARDRALKDHHDRCVETFVKTEGAGRGRMILLRHTDRDYPKSIELPPEAPELDDSGKPLPARPVAWAIQKTELIGLLKGDRPGAYPADPLKKARELDGFEQAGVARLKEGAELHVEETPGQLRVLGAVRMQPACARCHEIPEGTVLGAFSYVMKSAR